MLSYLTDFYIYIYSLYYGAEEIPNPNLRCFIECVPLSERKPAVHDDPLICELKERLKQPNHGLKHVDK